jgi:hypothetical protein
MSYVVAYTPEAHAGLRKLDSNLQEDVLDDMERLAANPALLPPRRANDLVYVDVIRDRGETRYFVFVTVRVSHARQVLQVIRMGNAENKIQSP